MTEWNIVTHKGKTDTLGSFTVLEVAFTKGCVSRLSGGGVGVLFAPNEIEMLIADLQDALGSQEPVISKQIKEVSETTTRFEGIIV